MIQLLWEKAKDFLQRAFTVIFLATIIIWFLQTFDFHFNMVADSQNSILASIAGLIAPIFAPLGFGDWRISTALISGFMAKESVVSTLSVLIPSNAALTQLLSPGQRLGASGILSFVYTLCGSHCLHQAGTGRKMVLFRGGGAVYCGLAGRVSGRRGRKPPGIDIK